MALRPNLFVTVYTNTLYITYRVDQKKGRSQNIIVFHELLSLHIGSGKVSSVRRSVSCLSRFELRMRAILLLCQSVGHISEVLKYQMNKNLCLLLFQYFHA